MICFSMFDIVNLFLKKTMGWGVEKGGWEETQEASFYFLFSWFEVLWLLAGV